MCRGVPAGSVLGDLHRFDVAGGAWTDLSGPGPARGDRPSPRAGLGLAATAAGGLLAFGGHDASGEPWAARLAAAALYLRRRLRVGVAACYSAEAGMARLWQHRRRFLSV